MNELPNDIKKENFIAENNANEIPSPVKELQFRNPSDDTGGSTRPNTPSSSEATTPEQHFQQGTKGVSDDTVNMEIDAMQLLNMFQKAEIDERSQRILPSPYSASVQEIDKTDISQQNKNIIHPIELSQHGSVNDEEELGQEKESTYHHVEDKNTQLQVNLHETVRDDERKDCQQQEQVRKQEQPEEFSIAEKKDSPSNVQDPNYKSTQIIQFSMPSGERLLKYMQGDQRCLQKALSSGTSFDESLNPEILIVESDITETSFAIHKIDNGSRHASKKGTKTLRSERRKFGSTFREKLKAPITYLDFFLDSICAYPDDKRIYTRN